MGTEFVLCVAAAGESAFRRSAAPPFASRARRRAATWMWGSASPSVQTNLRRVSAALLQKSKPPTAALLQKSKIPPTAVGGGFSSSLQKSLEVLSEYHQRKLVDGSDPA